MITEVVLLIALGILMLGFIVYVVVTQRQVLELNKALMARNLTEYTESTKKPVQESIEIAKEPDYVPFESIDNDTFTKFIDAQLREENVE